MGGYGALKLALKFPDMFCSAVSHSGALNITRREADGIREDMKIEYAQIFGPLPAGGNGCLFGLAERADRSGLPAIRIDCGAADGLLEANRAFHAYLDDLGVPHESQNKRVLIWRATGVREGGIWRALGME